MTSRRLQPLLRLLVALILGGLLGQGAQARARDGLDCGSTVAPATPASPAPSLGAPPASLAAGALTIFAAASLTDALLDVETTLEAANPDLKLSFSFAGSQALLTRLRDGAEADLFAPASSEVMERAAAERLIAARPLVFARNRLVVVVPMDNPAAIAAPADLARSDIKLVLAGADVPAGRYARQSLCLMAADPAAYGEAFAERVAANVASEETNVKAVLTKVRLGEADAGIVYTTDVTDDVADEVQAITIPPAVNVVADYPIAPVAGGDVGLANAFLAYLLGREGQAILRRHGFEPPPDR